MVKSVGTNADCVVQVFGLVYEIYMEILKVDCIYYISESIETLSIQVWVNIEEVLIVEKHNLRAIIFMVVNDNDVFAFDQLIHS